MGNLIRKCKIGKEEDLSNCAKKDCEHCRHYVLCEPLIDDNGNPYYKFIPGSGLEEGTVKKYEIWMDGYLETGMEGNPERARILGVSQGVTFKEACINFFADDNNFSPDTMSYWICKLYDSVEKCKYKPLELEGV